MSTLTTRSLAGGEIAPALYARVDTSKYQSGLRTLRNLTIMRHGGVQNRPGSQFVAEVKDSTKKVRLIPFVFNADQTYVLEFGHLYMRVHRNGGPILETAVTGVTGVTNANPIVVTKNTHGLSVGNELYLTGFVGMSELNGRSLKVLSVPTANTFTLGFLDGTPVDSTSWGTYISGGQWQRVYTLIATGTPLNYPYTEADLPRLQFVQSADVITITHPSYPPKQLSRGPLGHTDWTFSTIDFAPQTTVPTVLSINPAVVGTAWSWTVTAIHPDTREESLPATAVTDANNGTTSVPKQVGWLQVPGITQYNIYKSQGSGPSQVLGYIGTGGPNRFYDDGQTPIDYSDTPPQPRSLFNSTDNYPSTVSYFQQRLCFANSYNEPETVWTSRIGQFTNFTYNFPQQADDAVTFTLAGRQVNEVRHILDLGRMVLLTSGGEWVCGGGDDAGSITPTDINPRQHSYHGSSYLSPIITSGTALFVQARGSIVRDLSFDIQVDGYRGNDLTTFSAHLFDGKTITDWAFQQIPHQVIWAVRDDGILLALTYVKEHQISGWHRHDTDGVFENVCVVPEGTEDTLYAVVKRTIDGSERRYIERFSTRLITDPVDAVFLDSSLTYDGRNTLPVTLELQDGVTWDHTETLLVVSSASSFTTSDIGKAIHLTGADGTLIRFNITGYTSASTVSGMVQKTVPVGMRNTPITQWAIAVSSIGGLWHLEGKEISVYADAFVVASPNNEAYQTVTVTNGIAQLDKPYAVIHAGLPYMSDIETLDIDTAEGETLADKNKITSQVTLHVEKSSGIWIGAKEPTSSPLDGLTEFKSRNVATGYEESVELRTGTVTVNIRPEWSSNGRIFIRQVDPLPLAVLAISPSGIYPVRRR